MSEQNPPAGAENQQTQAEAETQQTPPAAASGGNKPDVRERLARQERKLRAESEAAVAKAREEAIAEFREEHGLDDDALSQWQQRDSVKAEIRSAKAQVTKAQNELAAYKQKAELYWSHLDRALRGEAIMQEAVRQGSNDPEVVSMLLSPTTKLLEMDGKLSVAVVDEHGDATDGTIEDAVKNLLAKKPHLAAPGSRAQGTGSRLTQHRTADDSKPFATKESRIAHLQKVLAG